MFDSSEMRLGRTRSKNNNNNNNNSSNDERLPFSSLRLLAPPLRLVSAAMWKVMQQRDAMHYGKLEEFVTSVSETVPGLLRYRHQAKLSVGLRARMILEQLRLAQASDPELILSQLEKLRAPALPNSKKIRNDQKVELSVKNFHTLVQTLLEKPAEREHFFKEEFDSQYGPQYDSALEKLLWEFLTRLDQLLPVPDLAQTVSWIAAAPAVLEECARSLSQPQLLRPLLQHEKCLGHLDSAASILYSTGDSILSSLSLTLSGKVRDSNQSGFTRSTPSPNIIQSPTSSTQKANTRQTRGYVPYMSQIPSVIGSISTADIPHAASTKSDVESVSDKDIDGVESEGPVYTRVRSRSCRKSAGLENVQGEEQCVGKVIDQTPTLTNSEVEEEESGNRPVRRLRERSGENDKQGRRSNDKTLELGQKKKMKVKLRSKTSLRNSKDTEQQEEEVHLHVELASCMKPLRVIIPRLDINASTQTVLLSGLTDEEHSKTSSEQPEAKDVSAVRHVNARNRKRKLGVFETPEKNLNSNIDDQVYIGSPCIPKLTPLRMENSDAASPVAHCTEDVIVDSEDEATENVKGKLFTKQYCKTKSDTYIPTLHEFWTPPFFRRDLLSPGNGCR